MADLLQAPVDNTLFLTKLRDSLSALSERVNDGRSTQITTALAEIMSTFKRFFSTLGEPQFNPQELVTGDTARSAIYNDNLRTIYNDISSFYTQLTELTTAQIQSYNFAQIVTSELIKRADGLSSIVLDLNILNNFTAGSVIVAGDDFRNTDFIDSGTELASTPVELLSNGSGVGLARDTTVDLTASPNIKIDILPLSPSNKSDDGLTVVNTNPTPGNIERFYEGNYYNFLGLARPEGGAFNIKFVVDPKKKHKEGFPKNKEAEEKLEKEAEAGFFVEIGASDEEKQRARRRMFDRDPSSFWEAEYLFRVAKSLVPDIVDSLVIEEDGEKPDDPDNSEIKFDDPDSPKGASFKIDLNLAEKTAQEYDFEGRDLIIDVVVTFPNSTNVNFVALNPIVFGTAAFIAVDDISTASDNEGEFITVDGWQNIKFAKVITPEANEFLTDSQLSASLAPNRFAYTGQGIYPFPVRVAKKIKIRLRMDSPVPSPYERTYALLKRTIDIETETTTTTKRGALRF